MVFQHSRFVLALIAVVTFLLTISSVRVLSGFIAAQHTAASASKGTASGEWGRFVGQTEANTENHIPHLLHKDEFLPSKGLQAAHAAFAHKTLMPSPYMQTLQATMHLRIHQFSLADMDDTYRNNATGSDLCF